MKQRGKNRYSDEQGQSEYYEALSLSLQTKIEERYLLSKLIMSAHVELVGLIGEVALHEARKGKTDKSIERKEQYQTIMKALDEAGRLDNMVYTFSCLVEQLKGERNLWYQKFKEAETQLEATRKAWEAA